MNVYESFYIMFDIFLLCFIQQVCLLCCTVLFWYILFVVVCGTCPFTMLILRGQRFSGHVGIIIMKNEIFTKISIFIYILFFIY